MTRSLIFLLAVGVVLSSVGCCPCRNCRDIRDLQREIMKGGLVIERPEGEREQWIEPVESGDETEIIG